MTGLFLKKICEGLIDYWQEWPCVIRHMIRNTKINVSIILLTYLCKSTVMIRNYNAYLKLALFGHGGHCITIANVSLQFKRYYFNINTNCNHSQRSHIFQCSISTVTMPTNIIIIQVFTISLNIILNFCLFHFRVRLDNMEGIKPYYNFD